MHACILLSCSEGTEDVNHSQKTFMDKSEQTVKLHLYYENKEHTAAKKSSLIYLSGRSVLCLIAGSLQSAGVGKLENTQKKSYSVINTGLGTEVNKCIKTIKSFVLTISQLTK